MLIARRAIDLFYIFTFIFKNILIFIKSNQSDEDFFLAYDT
jgi:hypothetical protein